MRDQIGNALKAGFWIRFAAWWIDILVLGILLKAGETIMRFKIQLRRISATRTPSACSGGRRQQLAGSVTEISRFKLS